MLGLSLEMDQNSIRYIGLCHSSLVFLMDCERSSGVPATEGVKAAHDGIRHIVHHLVQAVLRLKLEIACQMRV